MALIMTEPAEAFSEAHIATRPPVLLVHNFYQRPGGEDSVFRAEGAMMRERGHTVHEYTVHNDAVANLSRPALAAATIWNRSSEAAIDRAVATSGAAVAHFHNTFPLISPSASCAARRRGAGVVQTLHNYRLFCPAGMFFRDGEQCEACLGAPVPWRAVMHGCYRQSRSATSVAVSMLTFHRAIGTYDRGVDVYVALTEFGRRKFIEGGLPAERIVVKPNAVADPGVGRHAGGNVLFVGRLTPEKGIEDLLLAWRRVHARTPEARLTIIGDGPCANLVSGDVPGVTWLGWRSPDEVIRQMQDAAILVFPSIQREGFPMTIVEAFATGLPVVASRFESMLDIVRDGEVGRLYRHHDEEDLAAVLENLLRDEGARRAYGLRARAEYEAKYTPARNYAQLMAIYDRATESARRRAA